jgi:type II secretory pathway component PulM
MNYSTPGAIEKQNAPKQSPVGPQIVETFESNLQRMHSMITRIEEQCHNILNLRTPSPEMKSETPMENDLAQAIGNRLNTFALLNDRLDRIIQHLDKVVG